MKNVKMKEKRKSLSEIIMLVWIHVKIKWNCRRKTNYKFINNKFIDLSQVYSDADYVYCNGVRLYDLKKKKHIA
jgi:hypothetical protein